MFSYENGVGIAFLIWLFYLLVFLYSINSLQVRNLRKIGQRISWLTLTAQEAYAEDLTKPIYQKILKAFFIQSFNFIWIFLSWIYVAWVVGVVLFVMSKNIGMPRRIKEFRWKLRNLDMSRDQLIKEIMILNELDTADFDKFKEGFIENLRERGVA